MNHILLSTIAGGIAGGLGYIISKKIHGKEKCQKYYVMYMLGIFFPLQLLMQTLFPSPGSKMQQALESRLPKNIYAEIKNLDKMEMSRITFSGIKRLESTDLYTWNKIRLKMAQNSKDVCAGFWTGLISEEQVLNVIDTLTEEEQNAWIGISAKAFQHEMEKKEFTKMKPESMNESLKDLAGTLNDNNKIKFVTVLNQGASANKDDACFEMLEILSYVDNSRSLHREALVNNLAQIGQK